MQLHIPSAGVFIYRLPPKNLPNKNDKDIAPGLFMGKFPGKG